MSDVTPPKRDLETAAPETGRLGDWSREEWMRLLGVSRNVGEFYRPQKGGAFHSLETERLYQAWVAEFSPRLLLWLPGYHTPSLNVTSGRHWGVYHRHKKAAAGALLEALKERKDIPTKTLLVVDALAQGGKLGKRGELIRLAAKQEAARSKKAKEQNGLNPELRARVTYTRVTCAPLDTENFVGSTKGLTDCLRLAFPLWIPDDAPEFVEILHKQERCATRDEEGTWVELRLDGNDE